MSAEGFSGTPVAGALISTISDKKLVVGSVSVQLMKEAKKMQADIEKSQEELQSKDFEATAGGGAITVKVGGNKEIKSINISKDVVDPDDVEMLQDLILTCTNEALRKVDSAQAASLGKYNIPGIM